MSTKRHRHRGRDRPDAQLQRGPVGDELRDVFADPPLHVADRTGAVLVGRHVDLDPEVDVVHVDEALAEGPRHRPVELDDDRLRGPDRGVHRLDRRPERAEAVSIGRCRVDEDRIERHGASVEELRHVREEDRHVVRPPLVDRRPGIRADEERPMPEVGGHLGREVRAGALAMQVDHGDVVELRRPCHERVEEHRRRRRRAVQVDLLA